MTRKKNISRNKVIDYHKKKTDYVYNTLVK